jgi:NTE family protein
MPFGSEGISPGIGLALSGGGFRAMLFHCGAVLRLNELGLLSKLARISAVSGGSLLLGRLATRWPSLAFDAAGIATRLADEVVQPLMRFSERHVDIPALLMGLLPGASAADRAATAYRTHLVGGATLQDLTDSPRFVFNATHTASGVNWRFSKPYMGCYRLGLVRRPAVEVAVAMAASAAFPPVLSPLTLRLDPGTFEEVEGADLFSRQELRERVALTDGGVYDNLGIETVWTRYETVFCSDAGGRLPVKTLRLWDPLRETMRAFDIAREQCGALRRIGLVNDFQTSPGRNGSLWMTTSRLERFPVRSPFPVAGSWRAFLGGVRTRLNPFTEPERCWLVNWGYLVSDVALRSWRSRVDPAHPFEAPKELPFPSYAFAAAPPGGAPDLGGALL